MFRALQFGLLFMACAATTAFGGGPSDEKAIEGKWKVIHLATGVGGTPPPDKMPVFIFKGGRFTVLAPGQKNSEGRLILDAAKKPKQINMQIEVDQNPQVVGKTVEGLYDFRQGKLLLCIKMPGMGRPTEFGAPAGQMQILATLEKVKE